MADIGSGTLLSLTNTVIPTSYYIFQKNSTIFAKNGLTGLIDFSSSDASTIIQDVLDVMTSGGELTIGGGTYTLTIPITISTNIIIRGFGIGRTKLIAKNSLNADILTIKASKVFIKDFSIDGNKSNQTTGRGIVVTSPTNLEMDASFDDMHVTSCKGDGIFLDTTILDIRLYNILVELSDGDGFNVNGANTQLIGCESTNNGRNGYELTGTSHSLISCISAGNTINGIMGGSFRSDYTDCVVEKNFQHGMFMSGNFSAVEGGQYFLNNKSNSIYSGITVVGQNCRVIGAKIGESPSTADSTGANTQLQQYNLVIQSSAVNTIISNNTLMAAGASLGNILDQGIQTIINKNFGYSSTKEVVGLASPSILFPDDTGKNWKDLGALTTTPDTISYLGNGIAIDGDFSGHIFRSTDYGNTWFDLGVISANAFNQSASSYLGNGIAIVGDSAGHIWRSTDFGLTWTDLGKISAASSPAIRQTAYFGNGITIFGDTAGHIWRSTDFGLTWTDLGAISSVGIFPVCYLGNGIAIVGNSAGHIFRSTDSGLTYTDLGAISNNQIRNQCYLGNGIALAIDSAGHIFRSIDFGLTYTDLGAISTDSMITGSIAYVGNGIVIFGDSLGHIFRSTDYGFTWTNLGAISTGIIESMSYLGNGVIIFGDSLGHIFRSEISYKTDESQVNFPRKIVNAARGTNTTYTNSDNTRSLLVFVIIRCQITAASGKATAQAKADTGTPPTTAISGEYGIQVGINGEDNSIMGVFMVGPGLNYRLDTVTNNGTVTPVSWFEMYI